MTTDIKFNVIFARSCTVVILFLCCIIVTTASKQSFSYLDKQYYLIKETKGFDNAAAFCANRSQRLVQIDSQEENDFIFNSIVKSTSDSIWIGATNLFATKSFVWLDGSRIVYSNWRSDQPDDTASQLNGICLHSLYDNGQWCDCPANTNAFFICETIPIFALQSNLIKHTDQLNATAQQLEIKFNALLSNGTTALRSEYAELISEVKQSNALIRDQMLQAHAAINSNMNNLSFKVAGLSVNHTEIINIIESSLRSVNERQLQLGADIRGELQAVNAKLVATEDKLADLIKGQVVEYSYLGKQYVLTREYKNFYSAARVCKNRNESLVHIRSQLENEFIFNTIVKPSGHATWLGATNEIGSDTFKWLDGNQLTYSNWDTGFPDRNADEGRNAILMSQSTGQWFDQLATGNGFVLCEKPTVFALQSTVLGQSVTILEQSVIISKLEQQSEDSSNRLERAQLDVISLKRQANRTERQNAELETRLKSLELKLIKS